MAQDQEASPEDLAARLLEFGLVRNFECVARFAIPEPFRGCCGPFVAIDSNARNERLRQEFLVKVNKTDEMIEESILLALRKCPSLATKMYKNFAGQDMFPLWYFVLSGSVKEKVEEVYHMFPPALNLPVREEVTSTDVDRFSLLEAACSCSQTRDEVLLFLAQNCPPESLSSSFQYEPLPFVARAIDRPRRNEGVELAPLYLVKALAPPASWSLDWFNELFGLGYSAEVLEYAANMVIHNSNNHHLGTDILALTGPFGRPKCVLDEDRANVIDRLLRSHATGAIVIKEIHCIPKQWTRSGLHCILQCLETSAPPTLSLKIESEMFVEEEGSEGGSSVSDLIALQRFFAANRNIHTLILEVEKVYLEAIAYGLVQRKPPQPKFSLTIVPDNRQEPAVDVTDILIQIFNQGFLQKLCIRGTFSVDIFQICSSLLSDTTLQSFEMDLALQIPETGDERCPLKAVLDLLKHNSALEQIMLYDKKRGLDYTGFTKCPREVIKSLQRFYKPRVYDEDLADQMLHYMLLNQCGRRLARSEGTSKEDFVRILEAAKEKQWWGSHHNSAARNSGVARLYPAAVGSAAEGNSIAAFGSSDIYYFNVVFGLLVESAPSLWSRGAE